MINTITSYTSSRSTNELLIDALHGVGVVFFIGLVWVMFCGYIITPPTWWYV